MHGSRTKYKSTERGEHNGKESGCKGSEEGHEESSQARSKEDEVSLVFFAPAPAGAGAKGPLTRPPPPQNLIQSSERSAKISDVCPCRNPFCGTLWKESDERTPTADNVCQYLNTSVAKLPTQKVLKDGRLAIPWPRPP